MALFHADFYSQALSGQTDFWAVLPNDVPPFMAGENPHYKRAPKVVVLLHGYSGNSADWGGQQENPDEYPTDPENPEGESTDPENSYDTTWENAEDIQCELYYYEYDPTIYLLISSPTNYSYNFYVSFDLSIFHYHSF